MASMMVKVPLAAKPGQLLQMTTPHGTQIQCQVPHGLGPDRVFQIQYPLPEKKKAGGLEVFDESTKFNNLKPIAAHMMPSYWTNVKIPDNAGFDQMVYVDRDHHPTFNVLFDLTYRAKATQDRKCPNGRCAKTPGGCPCVQTGANPGMPTGFKVRRVVRVEDSEMWGRYIDRRDAIQQKRQEEMPIPLLDPPAISDEAVEKYENTFDPLDNSLNEVYLWHGTNVRRALSIAQNDFRIDLAGSSTGTMYGLGAYLAEHCTKADEYSSDEPGGYYEGVFALLLCRVTLGKFYYTEERDTSAGDKVRNGDFDSTLGDRLKKAGTFREFVVYDSDAIYPEYVVLYSRVHHADSESKIEKLTKDLYHLQLPVYWANCDKDPSTQVFHEQYLVNKHTVSLLQELVDACFKGTGELTLVSAKRVENSQIWAKYVQKKVALTKELFGAGRRGSKVLTAQELDDHHGETLTFNFLNSRDSREECISTSNLEQRLNEHLLWHGTTKEAAQKIAATDFHIPVGKEMKHAARFGNGAYLAEDIEKSLTYTEEDDQGYRWVLLCRAVCGDFLYTTDHTRIDANKLREENGKHSVLANPEGVGPREFIVPTADQVYPEFILQLQVKNWDKPEPVYMKQTKMQITVPPGVYGPRNITVQLPDGREVQVQVPPGIGPGTVMEIVC